METRNINLIAPINQLGYGIVGLNILKSLMQQGINVALFPLNVDIHNQEDLKYVQKAIDNQGDFDYNAPCIKIWHQYGLDTHVGRGEFIGFPIFELDTFNPRELHHLRACDRIFVCSNWAKEIIKNNLGIETKVDVIPLGVDLKIFQYIPKTTNTEKCIFVSAGKWEVRKGHDLLPEIFNKAFGHNDNVELYMITSNPFLTKDEHVSWMQLYTNTLLKDKIKFIARLNSQKELAQVMGTSFAGLFPSRGEGFNLELIEMLAMGKHIITTNYSGHTEFCTTQNSLLVDIDELEIAYDGRWFKGTGNWAKIKGDQINKFIDYLRFCYQCWKEDPYKTNEDGLKTAYHFSWDNSAKCIIDKLHYLVNNT